MILVDVKKKLGEFTLDIKKFSVLKPGVYGLIGPNGCGKSTLAKIITGLIEPDNGYVDTNGLNIRDITFLGRKPYMMDDTVYKNLIYPLKVRNIEIAPEIIKEYLARMKFSKKEKQRAKSLSGGEQQKLAFLRAIIFKPKLVITDEAMTAMDMDSLDLFEQTIVEEQKRENSIWIIISHQMPHIRRICEYIFFMHDGKIETEGTTQEIFSDQNNVHLKNYLRTYGAVGEKY
jgi:ABC-type multidrug transport system ATPase subunit